MLPFAPERIGERYTHLCTEAASGKIGYQMEPQPKNSFFKQFVSYALVGTCASAVDLAVFSGLVYLVHLDDLIANVISVAIGITVSFILNRKFTFGIRNHTALRYVSFFTVGTIGLGLSETILYFFGEAGFSPIIAKLISVAAVGIFQFLCNRFISFRTRGNGQ